MTVISRSYEEGCIAAHALDLIGDRWALLVVRELMLGPRRFGALRRGMPGISANILTRRLTELETQGILTRRMLPPPADLAVYELTAAGLALWPVLRALCLWGAAQPGHDPRQFISPAALMLSMAATWVAGAPDLSAGFDLAGDSFRVTIAAGRYHVARAAAEGADLQFGGTPNALAAVIYGPVPLAGHVAAGTLAFAGPVDLGQRFIDGFALRREPAAPPF